MASSDSPPAVTLQERTRNIGRLDELVVNGCQVYEFLRMAILPHPNLGSLYLAADQLGQKSESARYDTIIIPTNIFAGEIPSLHSLVLINIPVDANSPLLSANLTILRLSRGLVEDSRCRRFLSLPVLIEVLRRMPSLVELGVLDILTPPEPDDTSTLAPISTIRLLCLKQLIFHSRWSSHYRSFLEKVSYNPLLLKIDMGTTVEHLAESEHPFSFTSLTVMPPFSGLEVLIHRSNRFTLSGSRMKAEGGLLEHVFSADIKLTGPAARVHTVGIFSVTRHLPLVSTQTLRLRWSQKSCNDPHVCSIPWQSFLNQLPSLESIEITSGWSQDDCLSLAQALGISGCKGGAISFLCPNLCRLEFPYTILNERRDDLIAVFGRLADSLQLRHRLGREHGVKIELVIGGKLTPCNGPAEFARLRGLYFLNVAGELGEGLHSRPQPAPADPFGVPRLVGTEEE